MRCRQTSGSWRAFQIWRSGSTYSFSPRHWRHEQYLEDLSKGFLPKVAWLTPPLILSDHTPSSICEGENWTVRMLNALMRKPKLWSTTAVILT